MPIESIVPVSSPKITPGDMAQIVQSVFETMVNLEVSENGEPWFAGLDRITGLVHLSGDWNGVLLIECDHDQACRFAGQYLTIDPPETVNDDVRDVLGELANMIGGNLKSMLTAGIHLSMPLVVDGTYHLRVGGAELNGRIAFQTEGKTFWVALIEMGSPAVDLQQRLIL